MEATGRAFLSVTPRYVDVLSVSGPAAPYSCGSRRPTRRHPVLSFRFVHRTGVAEAAGACEVWRHGFLPAVSSPGRQPESRAGRGRSDEEQPCKLAAGGGEASALRSGGPGPRDGSVSPRGQGHACDRAPAALVGLRPCHPCLARVIGKCPHRSTPFRVCQGPGHGEYGGGEPRLDNVASGHPSPHLGTGHTRRLVGVTCPGPRAAAGNKADGEAACVERRSRRKHGWGSRPSPCA